MLTGSDAAFVQLASSKTQRPATIKAQDGEDESKAIKAEVFIKNRPSTTKRSVARYKPAAKLAAGRQGNRV